MIISLVFLFNLIARFRFVRWVLFANQKICKLKFVITSKILIFFAPLLVVSIDGTEINEDVLKLHENLIECLLHYQLSKVLVHHGRDF